MSDPRLYTVGWISAIKTEAVAAQQFLDEEHDPPEKVSPNDNNAYTLGRIGRHNVVMAVLPRRDYGTTTAAAVARDMLHSFPNIRIGLMVGIGGGVPSPKHDIRLGDIVVSSRGEDKGGIFQYDFGKTVQGKAFQPTQFLNQPPTILQTAVGGLEIKYEAKGHQLEAQVAEVLKKNTRLRKNYSRPPPMSDKLYRSDIVHKDSDRSCHEVCGDDPNHLVPRLERGDEDDDPAIHYGLIASGNQVMKDAHIRDMAAKDGVLCFEMEAAGLVNHFPCLVIRGICDYSDSHKHKEWQGYAAMLAAAYAKDLLRQIPPNQVEAETPMVETINALDEKLNDVRKNAEETKVVAKTIKTGLHIQDIARWLNPPDPSTNINKANKLRHDGTGSWLLRSQVYESWHSGSRRHLWLYGLAGCGKTVLSTKALDHLEGSDDRLVLRFFFDFSDSKKQGVDGMLRSLASQLYQHGANSSVLDGSFGAHGRGNNQPTTETLEDIVAKMLTAKKASIVLDALDESTTRSELLSWIEDITTRPELVDIQLLCTGRPEPEFLRHLRALLGEQNCVPLDEQAVNKDIRSYVAAQLCLRREFQNKNLTQDLRERIQNRVGDGAAGMFRWAACQLDSLAECLATADIKRALDNLPKNLTATYERMLCAIPEGRKKAATRLLQFMVHIDEPLTVKEAVDVIATDIDADPPRFHPDNRVLIEDDILCYAPGLLSIVEVTEFRTVEKQLHLAHFSVKEFLQNEADYERELASAVITRTFLVYLTDTTDSGHGERDDTWLTFMAAKSWPKYAALAELREDGFETLSEFFRDEKSFRRWVDIFHLEWDHRDGTSLYFAARFGLHRTAKLLLYEGADVNAQGGWLRNALTAAAHFGHCGILDLLLAEGADVQGGRKLDALHTASTQGHVDIVRILLERGADVNAPGGFRGNALHAASTEGHVDIVRILLERTADVNAKNRYDRNSLRAASKEGHIDIVKMLLERGADVNARGGQYGTALQAASCRGHIDIVQVLLERGTDVNAQGGLYGTALQAASSEGHIDIVKVLLERGADVNAQGGFFGNALEAALSNYMTPMAKRTEIVELLRQHGAREM